jgi:hypothetical protein
MNQSAILRGVQKPSIGRIVHYTANSFHEGKGTIYEVRAAIVTKVFECVDPDAMLVSLTVFHAYGPPYHVPHAIFEPTFEAGTKEAHGRWSWPKRE